MATTQQSIEIKVPASTAYSQLTQFEDYPQFMQEVEAVQQIDDTHLHWTTMTSNRPVEWDAEITEQKADRCIAWHNTSGPLNAGKVEVQSVGTDTSRVIFTLQTEPQPTAGSSAGNRDEEMAQRLRLDLARLKDFIEARSSETGVWRDEVHDAQLTMRDRGAGEQAAADAPTGTGSDPRQINQSTQSDYSLSRSSDDESDADGRFSVAEEVNFDQQSDAARHIGQMPEDMGAEQYTGESASDAIGETMHSTSQDAKDDAKSKLKPSIERSVPPSE